MSREQNETHRYVGLMSGTSADGIDAALVNIDQDNGQPTLVRSLNYPFPQTLREKVEAVIGGDTKTIDDGLALDMELGHCFANAVVELLAGETADAIGSHGQTVLHRPDIHATLQLGSGAVIAERTGITTVTDFRSRDMVLGGEGAPLTPAFHSAVFRKPGENRAVCNIGGISNITCLPAFHNEPVTGFDTGPGNTLMDGWCLHHKNHRFDANGEWARQGTVDKQLLKQLLTEPYLLLRPPKSTGRELFNLQWLDQQLTGHSPAPVDVQATLTEFTAVTITQAIEKHLPDISSLFICGGGAHNGFLIERLASLSKSRVESTAVLGVEPDWVEAIAFAWLSWRTLNGYPGNLPSVTGASESTVLGCIWPVNPTNSVARH